MIVIKLKPEFATHDPGFLGKVAPLGERSQEDLRWFIQQAQAKNHQRHLDMFEDLPTIEQMKELKAQQLADKAANATTEPPTVEGLPAEKEEVLKAKNKK